MPVPLSHGRATTVTYCWCSLLGRECQDPALLCFLKHKGEQAAGTVLLLDAFSQYILGTAPPQHMEKAASFTSTTIRHHLDVT